MKKFLSMALALAMALSLAACGGGDTGNAGNNNVGNSNPSGGNASGGGFQFERKIEIVCPWGAGGVSGVQYATQQPADG